MKDEFFDWLENCPVQWFLIKDDDGNIDYTFIKEMENEDE